MSQNQPPTNDQVPDDRDQTPDTDPQWLHEMQGSEESPDWLRRLIQEQEQAPGYSGEEALSSSGEAAEEPAAPGPAETAGPAEPGPEQEEVPDWVADLEPMLPPESESEHRADEGDLPDWIVHAAEMDQATGPEAEPDDELEAELPEWLWQMDPTNDDEPQQEEITTEPEIEAELPAELVLGAAAGMALSTEPEPDAATESPPEPAEAPRESSPRDTKPLREETLPEWLREDTPEPPLEESGAIAADEELDGWLQEAGQPDGEPAGERQVPGIEGQELPEWLHELAEDAPAASKEVPGEAESEVDFAEWLSGEQEDALPDEALLGLAAAGELAPEEIPDWVDELRPEEPEKEDLPVETSGPLVGLAGLLTAEPLMGLVPKSKYTPMPPVPEEQLAEARALRQLLDAPPKRAEGAPASPGRKVMQDLGRWFLFALLVIAVCVAVFVPELQTLIQPVKTLEAKSFYNAITGLPQTSNVLVVVDYDASHDGELTPQMRAILWHLLQRGLGVVTVSHTPQGAAIVEDALQSESLRSQGEVYVSGEHYLNLGYLPAHPASMQAFMANPLGGVALWGRAELDPAQTALGQRVTQFEDISLVVLVSSHQDHVRWWIEQAGVRPVQLVASVSASIGPRVLPYYNVAGDGQLEGMVVGLAGAAEYERLIDASFWPSARENFVLQASAQILLAVVVLVSGISVIAGRGKGQGVGRE